MPVIWLRQKMPFFFYLITSRAVGRRSLTRLPAGKGVRDALHDASPGWSHAESWTPPRSCLPRAQGAANRAVPAIAGGLLQLRPARPPNGNRAALDVWGEKTRFSSPLFAEAPAETSSGSRGPEGWGHRGHHRHGTPCQQGTTRPPFSA